MDIHILYFFLELNSILIVLFTKQLFIFPRFILIILLNTNVDDHQIEVTLSFKFHDIYHQLKINEFDISCSDLFEIYITDTQMLDAINYIGNMSKKKVT